MVDAGPEKHNFDFWIHFESVVMNFLAPFILFLNADQVVTKATGAPIRFGLWLESAKDSSYGCGF